MSKIDKLIEKRGWKVYQTIGDILPTYIEYHTDDNSAFRADTDLVSLHGEFAVKIFLVDMYEGDYAINSQYCIETDNVASGGDREYGHILRGLCYEDLKMFYRKMRRLRFRYRLTKMSRDLRRMKRRNKNVKPDNP